MFDKRAPPPFISSRWTRTKVLDWVLSGYYWVGITEWVLLRPLKKFHWITLAADPVSLHFEQSFGSKEDEDANYPKAGVSLVSISLSLQLNKRDKRRQEGPGMFQAITRLLFGGAEQTPGDLNSGEMAEEEWQVVSHQGQPQKTLLLH